MTLKNVTKIAKYKHSRVLSKYFCQLKDRGLSSSIIWEIISRAKACNDNCCVSSAEKQAILNYLDNSNLLNQWNELITTCKQKIKHRLKYTTPV